MAGKIKVLIDTIIETRSKGDEALMSLTRTKLLCKGINPNSYSMQSEDDMNVIRKLEGIAYEIGVHI